MSGCAKALLRTGRYPVSSDHRTADSGSVKYFTNAHAVRFCSSVVLKMQMFGPYRTVAGDSGLRWGMHTMPQPSGSFSISIIISPSPELLRRTKAISPLDSAILSS